MRTAIGGPDFSSVQPSRGCVRPRRAAEAGKTPAARLASDANEALQRLYAKVPLSKSLGPNAYAILVFPSVTKVGLGIGPSVVVMDERMGKSATTTTIKDDIYAFIFRQKGPMAGLGIQGNTITKMKAK